MNPVRRPGTAYSFVTEFEGSGKINPNPVTAKDSDLLFDIYLSPAKLVSPKIFWFLGMQQVTINQICEDWIPRCVCYWCYRETCLGLMIYSRSQAWRCVLTPGKLSWAILVRLMYSTVLCRYIYRLMWWIKKLACI